MFQDYLSSHQKDHAAIYTTMKKLAFDVKVFSPFFPTTTTPPTKKNMLQTMLDVQKMINSTSNISKDSKIHVPDHELHRMVGEVKVLDGRLRRELMESTQSLLYKIQENGESDYSVKERFEKHVMRVVYPLFLMFVRWNPELVMYMVSTFDLIWNMIFPKQRKEETRKYLEYIDTQLSLLSVLGKLWIENSTHYDPRMESKMISIISENYFKVFSSTLNRFNITLTEIEWNRVNEDFINFVFSLCEKIEKLSNSVIEYLDLRRNEFFKTKLLTQLKQFVVLRQMVTVSCGIIFDVPAKYDKKKKNYSKKMVNSFDRMQRIVLIMLKSNKIEKGENGLYILQSSIILLEELFSIYRVFRKGDLGELASVILKLYIIHEKISRKIHFSKKQESPLIFNLYEGIFHTFGLYCRFLEEDLSSNGFQKKKNDLAFVIHRLLKFAKKNKDTLRNGRLLLSHLTSLLTLYSFKEEKILIVLSEYRKRGYSQLKEIVKDFSDQEFDDEVNKNYLKAFSFCITCNRNEAIDFNLKTCARCKNIHYCSRECQVKHWPIHKKQCSEMKKKRSEVIKQVKKKESKLLEELPMILSKLCSNFMK